MSRIQHILEKAEREGAVRRVQSAVDVASVVSRPGELKAIASSRDALLDVGPQPLRPTRSISGVELHPLLASALAPQTVAAEQYRALRTRIFHSDNGSAVNVVLVTSPGRSEGKSLTAAALALTLAHEYERRICIVDADLRAPRLQRLLGVPDGPGLSDVLTGESCLEDAMVSLEDCQMTIVTAGRASGHPAELLGTAAMRSTIDQLRSRFDHIVIDTPSVIPLADVGVLAPLVDSVLLVVRAGVTRRPAIHDAIAAIDRAKLVGVVLNEAA
jgi:capsular exopolysaccharide synthesis family protein